MQMQSGPERRLSRSPIDTVVYLGAGNGDRLNAHLSRELRRAVLFEADPDRIAALQSRAALLPNAQVVQKAVAGQSGPAVLHRYNLADASSLRPASGLRQLFPGLREVDRVPVECLSSAELWESLQHLESENNLLVVDVPGEEFSVLDGLCRSGELIRFREISLYCGRQSLYEGDEPAERVLARLQDEGYDVVSEDDSLDPDRPCWTLNRNSFLIANRVLQAEVEQSRKEREAAEANAAILREKLVEQQQQAMHEAREVETLRSAQEDIRQRLGKAEKENVELSNAAMELRQRLEESSIARETQDGTLAKVRAELAEQQSQTKRRLEEVAVLSATLDERQEQLNNAGSENNELSRRCEEQHRQLEDIRQRHDKAEKENVELSNAAMELRQRLEESSIARETQDGTLAKVRTELAEQQSQTKRRLEEVEVLSATLNERQEQLNNAGSENDELSRRCEEQHRQLEELSRGREAQETAMSALRAELFEQQRHTKHWLQEAEALKASLNERQEQLDHAESGKSELSRSCDDQRQQLEELWRGRDALEMVTSQLRAELAEQQRQTMHWLQEVENLKNEMNGYQTDLASVGTARDELDRQIAERDSTINELNLAREKAELMTSIEQQRASGKVARANEKVESLQRALEESERRAGQLAEHCDSQASSNAAMQAEITAFQARVCELETQLSDLASSRDQEQLRADDLRQEVVRLVVDRDDQARLAADLHAQLAEQQRHTNYWLQEAQTLKQAAEAREAERGALESSEELLRKLAELEELRTQVAQLQDGKRRLEDDLTEQRSQTTYWMHELDKTKAALDEAKKRGDQIGLQSRETQQRQLLLDEELVKAEAQIDLIKDILIREKAF